jgi:hypothetical protein
MATAIDPSPYLVIPRLNLVAFGQLLAALIAKQLHGAPDAVRDRIRKLEQDAVDVEKLREERLDSGGDPDRWSRLFDLDHRLDSGWGGLSDRLIGWTKLAADKHPESARAEALHRKLFPAGLSFVKMPFEKEWAASEAILQQIDREKLGGEIDALASPQFLAEIRAAHADYSAMIDGRRPSEPVARVNVGDELKRMAADVSDYALQVIATADPRKPQTVEAARAALQPIDDFRAALKRSRKAEPKPAPQQ